MGQQHSTAALWHRGSCNPDAYLAIVGSERARLLTDRRTLGASDHFHVRSSRPVHRSGDCFPAHRGRAHRDYRPELTTRWDGFAMVHETNTTVEAVGGDQQLGVSLAGDEPARLLRELRGWSLRRQRMSFGEGPGRRW